MAVTTTTSGANGRQSVAVAVILGIGLAAAGWLAGHGFARGRTTDRYVTVKGIAEREVKADLALWPLRVATADNDLGRAQALNKESIQQIRAFLERNGIDVSRAELQKIEVTDAYVNQYQDVSRIPSRYVVNQTLMVRSDKPESILEASQKIGDLVSAGVVLSSGGEYGFGGPTFLFTRLNDLKPEMIGEATTRAREAAQTFARDSGSQLAGIRRANQGVFEILPRDQAPGIQEESQLNKRVRVVSTVEYFLRD